MSYAILSGITLKGKNRINEHGEIWEIDTNCGNSKIRPDQVLLISKNTGYFKWGPLPDFEIVQYVD